MEPLHYDDLPKTSAECWELLSESDRRAAVKAFLIHGAEREDDDLLEFKKAVLKHSSIAQIVKFFDVWSMDRQMQKSMQLITKGKHKEYRGSLVRYWLLVEHRTMIITTLDVAGIPNESGYIPDNFNEVSAAMWMKGLAALWTFEELPVRLYLGYVLKDTRSEVGEGIWQNLAEALGKGKPRQPEEAKVGGLAVQAPSVEASLDVGAEHGVRPYLWIAEPKFT